MARAKRPVHVVSRPFAWRLAVRWVAVAALSGAGCAAHLRGLVAASEGVSLLAETGGELRLVLVGPDANALSQLDGFEVEVWGQRAFGALRVARWHVSDGLHGMPVFVGEISPQGVQVAIEDRNTGAVYFLDDATARELLNEPGALVLVEGYVDGPHRIHVVDRRILRPSP